MAEEKKDRLREALNAHKKSQTAPVSWREWSAELAKLIPESIWTTVCNIMADEEEQEKNNTLTLADETQPTIADPLGVRSMNEPHETKMFHCLSCGRSNITKTEVAFHYETCTAPSEAQKRLGLRDTRHVSGSAWDTDVDG